MIKLSPGLAQGCVELLGLSTAQRLTLLQIKAAFVYLGGLPAASVIETAQLLNWLDIDAEGCVCATVAGERLLAAPSYEAKLRQALLDYIDAERPAWIQNATYGRSRVLTFASVEIAQVFVEAGLADGTADDIVEFWDVLAARARGQKNTQFTRIGRTGERLTIEHEQRRTGVMPRWIAIEHNADGYDVLSIVGPTDGRKLSIEVKSSTQGLAGSFFITRNEWERAVEADAHVFHLWDLAVAIPKLAVLPVSDLEAHIPCDYGAGVWQNVQVPFATFGTAFVEQSS